jgi:hypothetical protein
VIRFLAVSGHDMSSASVPSSSSSGSAICEQEHSNGVRTGASGEPKDYAQTCTSSLPTIILKIVIRMANAPLDDIRGEL